MENAVKKVVVCSCNLFYDNISVGLYHAKG